MKIVNETGLQLAWLPGRLGFPAHSLTLIAKGTYLMAPGAAATFAEDGQVPLSGDVYEDDEPGLGCRYDSDFAYYKPRADVALIGSCHCPGGEARTSCRVSLGVGSLKKTLAVYGDYFLLAGAQNVSRPRPFVSMPIHYSRSYGGEGFAANPIGKGAVTLRGDNGQEYRPLPNIQAVGQPLTSAKQHAEPAGFGPLDRTWEQRMSGMGTYDAAWEEQRWPWFPADFDWGTSNAAPRDQQIEGYLRGDEALAFENLHAGHADYRSALPGLRARCFLQEKDGSGAAGAIREVEMRLDSLWIDMERERLVLQWRGITRVRSQKLEELQKVLLVTESIDDAVPAAHYHPRFDADGDEAGAKELAALPPDNAQADAAPADAAPAEPPDMAAIEADVKQEVAAELEQMARRQPRSAATFARVKGAVLSDDPHRSLTALTAEAGVDPAAFDRAQARERERVGRILEAHGGEPGLLDPPPEAPPPPAAPAPEDYEAAVAAGKSFAGQDLTAIDLRGARLRGADFSACILSEAKLAGADLTGSNLAGAVLERADLGRATLARANLKQADLSRARMLDARLDRAELDDAVLSGADLTAASLIEASAEGTLFVGAKLTLATLEGARLDGADFAGSRLDRACLDAASLVRASMGDAVGDGVSMVEADLTELRAGDGCSFPQGRFTRVRADGSTWCQARLAGADFSGADLVRADFTGAELVGANLNAAELRSGDLSESDLTSAQLARANLFQASFKLADLTDANLDGSSCYGAEFWDAKLHNTRMSGTNIKMTKLLKA